MVVLSSNKTTLTNKMIFLYKNLHFIAKVKGLCTRIRTVVQSNEIIGERHILTISWTNNYISFNNFNEKQVWLV